MNHDEPVEGVTNDDVMKEHEERIRKLEQMLHLALRTLQSNGLELYRSKEFNEAVAYLSVVAPLEEDMSVTDRVCLGCGDPWRPRLIEVCPQCGFRVDDQEEAERESNE